MRTYGWIPDKPDQRDKIYTLGPSAPREFPDYAAATPREQVHIFDQGTIGSCTANALCGLHYLDQLKEKPETAFIPSRLFLYYNERAAEGTIASDAGASLRDGIKSINKQGICPEKIWPYVTFNFTETPIDSCYRQALHHRSISYTRLTDIPSMQATIVSGYGFVFGATIYEGFESSEVAKTGIIPMPGTYERTLGGHALLCTEYKHINGKLYFGGPNSWGDKWGDRGFYWMPADYLETLADDFWSISTVRI